MRKSILKRSLFSLLVMLLVSLFIMSAGQYVFAEDASRTNLFSDDYILHKGDTGESGTGLEGGLVPVSEIHPEDLRGKTIGNITGATTAQLLQVYYDDEIQLNYYDSTPDLIQALKAGKIDAYITDNVCLYDQWKEDNTLAIVYPYLDTYGIKAFFPKGTEKTAKIKKEYNEFLEKLRKEDKLNSIFDSYFNKEDEPLDLNFSGENGTLNVAVCATIGKPFCYYQDGQLNGYEPYLIVLFGKEYGYSIQFQDFNFAGMLAAVSSGKCDMGATVTQSTYEREETIEFSDAEYFLHHVLVCKNEDVESGGLINTIVTSFKKTFIVENRWMLFLKGVLNTLLITVLSAVFGTLLGYVFYKMSASSNVVPRKIAGGLGWIIRGMPTVVLLMILYYIIFSKAHVGGLVVAIVAFTLTFAVAMMGMITTGVRAIDQGQYEGAIALGYTKKQTFRHIIFPQAVTHFMPLYSSEMIALIKATAIVGYIAVQDVTKVSDIVRSLTFDAFFPLIVVAILYFILGALLTAIVRYISKKMNRKERNRESILKGVKVHD